MGCGVLASGGKDSTLAALLLEGFYDVTLVTGTFGITEDWTASRDTAESVGLHFERLSLDRAVATAAVDRMLEDGFPRHGIQQVHQHALERAATSYETVADGTRRDDRVPTVSRATAQSIEDRHDVDYIAPLAGFGRDAVDRLVAQNLVVESGPSETIPRADYEGELRALIAERTSSARVEEIFPSHDQTRVTGRRDP